VVIVDWISCSINIIVEKQKKSLWIF
jgi:hypothetical protein